MTKELCYTLLMRLMCASVICLLLLSACSGRTNIDGNSNTAGEIEIEETAIIDPIQVRAFEIASSLNDRLLSAQVIICGIDGTGNLPPHMKTLLTECPAGGIMLFKYNLDTDNDSIRSLVSETVSLIQDEADIPPFVAADHEGGSVNRFRSGVAALPAASSYWELFQSEGRQAALAKIESDSNRAGREINDLGINLNFAPVAEYLNDNNRDFLSSRSYGPDPFFTAEAASAFVRGMESAGVLCVIKHFPGSAGADPHYSASVINLDKTALNGLISPFASLFNNGARAVMIAHSAVPAIDGKIASLSSVVMKDWLRDELGFSGLIISDDFSMEAARSPVSTGTISIEDAAIQSIASGSNMVLVWQKDLIRTHSVFLSALEDGRLSRERLQDAAQHVIYEKIRMGLIDGK